MRGFIIFIAVVALLRMPLLMAQEEVPDTPPSFRYPLGDWRSTEMVLPAPDYDAIGQQDELRAQKEHPYRMAVLQPVDVDFSAQAHWITLPNGQRVGRLAIRSEGAQALSVQYRKFNIPEGGKLYLLARNEGVFAGAYTCLNNMDGGVFANRLMPGSRVVLEYEMPAGQAELPELVIESVAHAYRSAGFASRGFGDAGPCHVNVNCEFEGENWNHQKQGVVKMITRLSDGLYLCSGSLVNNTARDFKPYLLTADHCAYSNYGVPVTDEQFQQWQFYFNYEAPDCALPANEPPLQSLVGCKRVANGGHLGESGSDFLLLELLVQVPVHYQPYFNGWTHSPVASNSGVGIHHPSGDVKKISTYSTTLGSAQWGSASGSHWKVFWRQTPNGHGVTEGGSSGSPLFNEAGLIVGTLTGGLASCNTPDQPDYYGKFSYHWEGNGDQPSEQLRPHLDPQGTGQEILYGSYYSESVLLANFEADTTVVPVGGEVHFNDLSNGNPAVWSWMFDGGEPGFSDRVNPVVKYNSIGVYTVRLEVQNEMSTDAQTRKQYIKVVPVVYPVPTHGLLTVLLGKDNQELVRLSLYSTSGMQQPVVELVNTIEMVKLNLNALESGIYFLRVENSQTSEIYKIQLQE